MKISYNWLKDFVNFDIAPDDLAESLSMAGFEVDSVDQKGVDVDKVVVGKVIKKEKHPNADKLSVCIVDVKNSAPLTIICGAPNVAAGQRVPVAKIGAVLPNGMKIRKAKIRGVVSFGMICSEEEMGLAEKSDGVWVLPDDLEIGLPLGAALNIETDYVLDIGITPNRPDGMNHIGIAREVAAIAGVTLHVPTPDFSESAKNVADFVSVEIDCPESCPRYSARLIRNITIGPSPDWMARRLEAVGMRSINNVVDITNYVMFETGQPLHAFDFKFVSGGKIIVRESRDGETFVTLDEKSHKLQHGAVLICDAEKPVALGGIMGGLNSEVNDRTTDVLLEAAYFQPENIQRSLRYLGMSSEASMRFERGVDPNGVLHAQARAVELLVKFAGGEVAEGVVDIYPQKIHPVKIELKTAEINRLIGTNLSGDEMRALLGKIEIRADGENVIAPTFRPDLTRVADIAEEVARLYGYDNIPLCAATPISYRTHDNPFDDFVESLKTTMTGIGIQEVVTNSLINSQAFQEMTGDPVYTVLNPLNADLDGLRNNLVPNLLAVLQWNIYRQQKDLAIFEINRVYQYPGSLNERPHEEIQLAVALTGTRGGDDWLSSRELFNFYDIKGVVEFLADKISLDKLAFIPYDNFAVENEAVKVLLGEDEIGYIGKLRNSLRTHFDIASPVLIAQLNVRKLFEHQKTARQFQEIPKFPRVERDLAVIVDRDISSDKIIETIRRVGGKYLKDAYVFDLYTGKQIEASSKSVGFRLIFQSTEKTLTDEEITHWFEQIMAAVQKAHHAKLRSQGND